MLSALTMTSHVGRVLLSLLCSAAVLFNLLRVGNLTHSVFVAEKFKSSALLNDVFVGNQTTSAVFVEETSSRIKFYIISTPEVTSHQINKDQTAAISFYSTALNEERAEIWLHRGLENMTHEQGHTTDPEEAHVFFIPAYLHLSPLSTVSQEYPSQFIKRLHNKTKPHVFLCPTWNGNRGFIAGIGDLIQHFVSEGVNTWSVGFERNPSWQTLPPERIIPIPYVVNPSFPREELLEKTRATKRTDDFVFYAGDSRRNAVRWAGCNRSMILPLSNTTNMEVGLRGKQNRLSQDEYNVRMLTSDFCLILCGDTPTSRSLSSAIIYGCIPVRVGSRLRGLCEPPCHKGYGWSISGEDNPHLPYSHSVDWQRYPEVNEKNFSLDPLATLQEMFQLMTVEKKDRLRQDMKAMQMGWIYGWGNPVTSEEFGDAAKYIWKSIVATV